jgi:hypothetical protein
MGAFDGDEGMVGLVALDARAGRFATFLPGQLYGGTGEPLLAAVTTAILGTNVFALRLPMLLLNLAGAWCVFDIARHLPGVERRAAAWTAGLYLVMPAMLGWLSWRAFGFYELTLACSLAVLALAVRIAQGAAAWSWLALGLAAGIGWWQSPQSVFVMAPAIVWLLLRTRSARGLGGAAIGFVMGAAPWLAFVARNGLDPLRTSSGPSAESGPADVLANLLTEGLPMLAGARVGWTYAWLGGPLGVAVTVGALVAAVLALRASFPRSWADPRVPIVSGIAAYPALLALQPGAAVTGTGRYLAFCWPLLALLVGPWSARLLSRPALATAVAAAIGAWSVAGVVALGDDAHPFMLDGSGRAPTSVAAAIDAVDELGSPGAIADYWNAMRMRFETGDQLRTASFNVFRHPDVQAEVLAMSEVAWVVTSGSVTEQRVLCGLRAASVPVRSVSRPPFVAVAVPNGVAIPADPC